MWFAYFQEENDVFVRTWAVGIASTRERAIELLPEAMRDSAHTYTVFELMAIEWEQAFKELNRRDATDEPIDPKYDLITPTLYATSDLFADTFEHIRRTGRLPEGATEAAFQMIDGCYKQPR